ncbi:MAG: FtsX-like permease family protein, partial [Nocardioidaceae bacterium]
LAILIAIQTAFQGGVAGTLLGDVVAVQVRGVDYLAAALTITLGAFAVADIAYLNINERTAEIGTFRASGWAEHHIRQLFGTEALLTATLGATLGAATGTTAVAIAFTIPWTTSLLAAATAATTGILAATLALTIPLAQLSHLAPATAITTE